MHAISDIFSDIISLDYHADIHKDLLEGQTCFVVKSNVRVVMTLTIVTSMKTSVHIYCHDNVDLTIRLIILFPNKADLALSVIMCGKNSNVRIFGMYVLAEQQSLTITTQQIHCGANSHSKLMLQGLLTDQSKVVHDGTIRIEKQAPGTYALQNNKNILLSSQSSAISIPNIEVLNHDVQCFHGAAVGQFHKEQMLYMQSRGLVDAVIKQLLVQALFQDVLCGYDEKELTLQKIYEKI